MNGIYDLVSFWESIGFFDIVLPFLLIFSVVYGILLAIKIFEDKKGVNVLISLAVGMLSIRTGMVQDFFAQIFPRLGIGIAVVLSVLILVGLFVTSEDRGYWLLGLGVLGIIIAAIIVWNSFSFLGWNSMFGGYLSGDAMTTIITIVCVLGIIIAVVNASAPSTREKGANRVPLGATT